MLQGHCKPGDTANLGTLYSTVVLSFVVKDDLVFFAIVVASGIGILLTVVCITLLTM